jgi:hypothetical protein
MGISYCRIAIHPALLRSTGRLGKRFGGWGGESNQFDFINDEGFDNQHDIRRLANGHITLFENGSVKSTPYSRAVEYAIDESEKTITLVCQYPENQDMFAGFMGNAQRLNNENTMIGWGSASRIEEVKPDGTVALEIVLEGMTYRAFRQEWNAIPIENPRVAVKSIDESSAMLYTSWNGATQIIGYEIYWGETVDSLTKKVTAPRSGFEAAVHLTDLDPNSCVFKVLPVHAQGATMPFSGAAYRIDQPVCLDLLTNDVYLPFALLH